MAINFINLKIVTQRGTELTYTYTIPNDFTTAEATDEYVTYDNLVSDTIFNRYTTKPNQVIRFGDHTIDLTFSMSARIYVR